VNAKKLVEVCEFISGLWTGKKPPYVSVGVIRNTNFHKNGSLDFSDIAQLDVEVKQFSNRQLRFGDIVLEKSGGGPKQPVGRVCVFEKEDGLYSLSNFTSAIRIKNPKELDYRYLHYYLKHLYIAGETEKIQTHSTGIRNLQLSLYKEFLVPLPPLVTQQKIVAKLDAIFAEIDKATAAAEANAKNAEALFQSYLAQVFENTDDEWNESELGKITKFIDYRGKTPTKTNDGIRLITAKNVKFGFLNREPYEYIAEKDYEGWMTRGIPKKGDVLFTTEAPLANVAQLDTDEKVVFAQRLIILQPQEKTIDSEFLKFSLLSRKVQNKIISKGTGATVKGIKASLLKLIPIEYPSLNRQREICKVLADVKTESIKLKDYYTRKVSSLVLYKNSILRQAFSGELVKE